MKRTLWTWIVATTCALMVTAPLLAQEDAQQELPEKYKERYTGELFREADTNNDGFVSFEEAQAASREIERDPLGKKRFNEADVNGDGMLSPVEADKYTDFEVMAREKAATRAREEKEVTPPLEEAQQEVSQKYKERYTGELFREADTNNDGFMSFEEARAASREIERDPLGKKRFNSADANDDGRLSPEEAKKYRGFEVMHREKAAARAGEYWKGNGEESRREALKEHQQSRRDDLKEKRRDRRRRPERRQ